MPLLSVFVVYVPTNTKNFFLASGLSAVWAGSSAATTADTKKRDANTRLVMFMGSSVAHVGLSECGSPAAALPLSATSEHGKAGARPLHSSCFAGKIAITSFLFRSLPGGPPQ